MQGTTSVGLLPADASLDVVSQGPSKRPRLGNQASQPSLDPCVAGAPAAQTQEDAYAQQFGFASAAHAFAVAQGAPAASRVCNNLVKDWASYAQVQVPATAQAPAAAQPHPQHWAAYATWPTQTHIQASFSEMQAQASRMEAPGHGYNNIIAPPYAYCAAPLPAAEHTPYTNCHVVPGAPAMAASGGGGWGWDGSLVGCAAWAPCDMALK